MDSLPESTVTTFKHEPRPDAANHMRLLEVLDESYSDTIKVCCRMTTWPTDSIPPYHAISYTWGDSDSNTKILINDQPFSVRTNCEFVLRQARWHAKSRYYWVDAVCIDQENLNEKSKQVAMMGKIYKRAEHVLACVGDHFEDSLFLFDNFGRVSPCVSKWKSYVGHNLFTWGLYWKLGRRIAQRFICACMNFTKCPYFTRLWVLQEMKNARQSSLVCGRNVLSRDEFEPVFFFLILHIREAFQKSASTPVPSVSRSGTTHRGQPEESDIFERLCPTKELIQKFMDTESSIANASLLLAKYIDPDPLALILHTRVLQCTMPKDRVYSIISLLDTGGDGHVTPDYTKSEFEVALDFLHAIWNTELVHKQKDSFGARILHVCNITIDNLDLHGRNSSSVKEALLARDRHPDGKLKGAGIEAEDSLPRAEGWAVGSRVSLHDLSPGGDEYVKYWSPRGNKGLEVRLPYWTREGDWVVQVEESHHRSRLFLVLREEAAGLPVRIVGQGYCEALGYLNIPETTFKVIWDLEDMLVFTFVQGVLRRSSEYQTEWTDALNTGVCRRETPMSSYAIKSPQN